MGVKFMDNPRQIFAERLKLLRTSKKLGQEELAKLVGIERSSISSYENMTRFPSIEVLISIADFFCVSTDYLVGVENKVPVQYISGLRMTSLEAKRFKDSLNKVKGLLDSVILDKDR
jgi:transcriptional regulator with XRE-family HTH domain